MNAKILAALVLCFAAACGLSGKVDASGNGSGGDAGSPAATVTGTVSGVGLSGDLEAIATVVPTCYRTAETAIAISSRPGNCAAAESNEQLESETQLVLAIGAAGNVSGPYTIGPGSRAGLGVSATLGQWDASCNLIEVADATAGTITISSNEGGDFAGSFSLTFANDDGGTLSGTFTATACAPPPGLSCNEGTVSTVVPPVCTP